MTLCDAQAARLRAAVVDVAAQMPGLSGPEQAYVLGRACERAGINPTWGELRAFLHAEPMRGLIEREGSKANAIQGAVAPGG